MPKEVVFHDENTTMDFDGRALEGRVGVQVGWQEHHVQIGHVFRYTEPAADGNPPSLRDGHPGWFVDLNRHDINRLISVLRKARDGAYGRDA